MRFRKQKLSDDQVVGRNRNRPDIVKVHSYYTLPARGSARPEIDTSARDRSKGKKGTIRSRVQFARKLTSAGVAIALIALVVFLARLSPEPIVIVDSTPSYGREAAYQQGVESMLRASLLNQNKVTLNKAALIGEIQKEFPEIKSVTISTALLGRKPVLHIREYEIPFRLESRGKTLGINSDGVIVGEFSEFALSKDTILLRDESGVEPLKGARVLRTDDALFFTQAKELLMAKGRELSLIRITSVPREAYLEVKGINYSIRVFLDESASLQIATFLVAERELGEGGSTPSVYMDVRAGEKVFWQ